MAPPKQDAETTGGAMTESGPNHEVWQGPLGTMRLRWNDAGGVRNTVSGYGHAEFVAPLVRRLDAALGRVPKVVMLFDWSDATSYDSGLRTHLTEWTRSHLRSIDGLHLITRSKIVAMGASVANVALGGIIVVHPTAAAFEALARKHGL